MDENKQVSLIEIRNFFGMKSAEFTKEWGKLTPGDKAQIKAGLSDGTLNY